MSTIKEINNESTSLILKAENWLSTPFNVPKWVTIGLEVLFSFLIVFIIGLPITLANFHNSEINSFWNFIGKITILRILWSSTTVFLMYMVARKFKVSMLSFGITYRSAARIDKWYHSLSRIVLQFIGAMLAIFAMTEMSIHAGNFIYELSEVNPENGHIFLGSSMGGVKPIMRGWWIVNEPGTIKTFHENYGFYTIRMFIEIFLIGIVAISMLRHKKFGYRKHMLSRYAVWFTVALIGFRFQAHSANLIRYIAGTSMMEIYGGYANWHLLSFVIAGHLLVHAGIFYVVRSDRFPNTK